MKELGGGQASLGEFPMTPNVPELIQRNLSRLKYHLRQVNDEAFGWYHAGEAERLIREHNRLVRENRRILNAR